ncbi:DUF222 domain-containing protein [Dactylosporangium sp. NPDC051484]|uniref:HNH endonuclease signature motif containing protein n=1 Tax=Dactylosporangium sp. NPDC051484 TaxID=3154942 RepID=UPI00344E6503
MSSDEGCVAGLGDAIAALLEHDPAALEDAALRQAMLALLRHANQLDAVIARYVGAFDDRRLGRGDGWASTKQWLQAYGRLSGPAATSRMRAATTIRLLPSLEAAFDAGEVTREHVDRIGLTAQEVGDEVVESAEQPLVAIARGYEPEAVREVCERLIDEVIRDQRIPVQQQYHRRGLAVTRAGDMWKLRGILDAETGVLLSTALDAFTKPPPPDDERNSAQRRHDALADLLNTTLREGRAPLVAGVRPHLALLMPVRRYAELHDHHGDNPTAAITAEPAAEIAANGPVAQEAEDGPAVLAGYGVIPDTFTARLSCDANLQHVWQHPDNGLPLQLGRAYRNTPPALRRALATRDPHCRWPGCQIPADWCDSHHLRTWIRDHGSTDIDNLVILCRYHHVSVHERGWGLRYEPADGTIAITRPDGTPYDLGPSRPRTAQADKRWVVEPTRE